MTKSLITKTWIGGLVNSFKLTDKTWFGVLVAGGVLALGFAPIGFAVMLAYVVAAPDGYTEAQLPTHSPKLAPTA